MSFDGDFDRRVKGKYFDQSCDVNANSQLLSALGNCTCKSHVDLYITPHIAPSPVPWRANSVKINGNGLT